MMEGGAVVARPRGLWGDCGVIFPGVTVSGAATRLVVVLWW